jgi:hypothetical protein
MWRIAQSGVAKCVERAATEGEAASRRTDYPHTA